MAHYRVFFDAVYSRMRNWVRSPIRNPVFLQSPRLPLDKERMRNLTKLRKVFDKWNLREENHIVMNYYCLVLSKNGCSAMLFLFQICDSTYIPTYKHYNMLYFRVISNICTYIVPTLYLHDVYINLQYFIQKCLLLKVCIGSWRDERYGFASF